MNDFILVESDAYEFLKTMYFGVYSDPFEQFFICVCHIS